MKFTLEIDLDNSAFEGDYEDERSALEIVNRLKDVIQCLEIFGSVGVMCSPIRDSNGNTCGYWQIS